MTRKVYKNLTGGVLSITRSELKDSGALVGLPPVEFAKNAPLITTSESIQKFLESHPYYGRWFVAVEAEQKEELQQPQEPADQPEVIEPGPEGERVEVRHLNEVRDYLNEKGIDTSGLRSWESFIEEGAKNGIEFVRL